MGVRLGGQLMERTRRRLRWAGVALVAATVVTVGGAFAVAAPVEPSATPVSMTADALEHRAAALAAVPGMPAALAIGVTLNFPPPPPPAPEPQAPEPRGSVEDAIATYFGDMYSKALSVARCESTLNPNAVSPGGGNHGLFQINTVHRGLVASMGYSWSQIYDPYVNSAVARRIYDESGWSPWACG